MANCAHNVIVCPNGEGDPFACESFCSLCEGSGDYCETCAGKAKKQKNYTLNAYADGFAVWHCEIFFSTPLGNTSEAEKVLLNALAAAKRTIRREIAERMAAKPKRLAYEVKTNKSEPGLGRLMALTIAEKEN